MIWFSAADCNNTHSKRKKTLLSTFLRGRERLLRSLGYLLEGRGEQTTQRLRVWALGAALPGFECQPCGSLSCLSFLGGFSKDDGDGRGKPQLWAEAQSWAFNAQQPLRMKGLGSVPLTTQLLWLTPCLQKKMNFLGNCHLKAFIYVLHAFQIFSYFAFCQ